MIWTDGSKATVLVLVSVAFMLSGSATYAGRAKSCAPSFAIQVFPGLVRPDGDAGQPTNSGVFIDSVVSLAGFFSVVLMTLVQSG